MNINLNNKNSFNVSIDADELTVVYTRTIDNKLYTIKYTCDDERHILETLSNICNMDDKTFKLCNSLSKSIEAPSDEN